MEIVEQEMKEKRKHLTSELTSTPNWNFPALPVIEIRVRML